MIAAGPIGPCGQAADADDASREEVRIVVRERVRRWLEPLLRLYQPDSVWRVPMLAGTILGGVMLLGGPIGAVVGAHIVRIHIRTTRP